jgi:hypothetical protein
VILISEKLYSSQKKEFLLNKQKQTFTESKEMIPDKKELVIKGGRK